LCRENLSEAVTRLRQDGFVALARKLGFQPKGAYRLLAWLSSQE